MQELMINEKEKLIMKLLHYFITEKSYAPVILHGAKDEIWLENLDHPYKIIRIVSNYIHNEEQYEYDLFRAEKILKSIQRKIMSFHIETISIFVNVNEDVNVYSYGSINCISVHQEKDLTASNILKEAFPDMKNKLKFTEKGMELFAKLTNDINEKSAKEAKKTEDVFAPKKPIVTRAIILVNTAFMLLAILNEMDVINRFCLWPNMVFNGEYYRLFTAVFLHGSIWHFLINNYAIYVIGSQVEGFYGKWKYLAIYLFSGICGNLLSLMFLESNTGSLGASGAVLGILGALLYFGYHYRVYLSNVLKSQIIPLVILNLGIVFLIPNIDVMAHIGGFVGGLLLSMAVGVKNKEDKVSMVNGIILCSIYILMMIYMIFFK